TMTKSELMDKVKGGWAGQTIGCAYGGPTEFRYKETIINSATPIKWDAGQVKWYYDHAPGLYDDVYMDLTFVKVFEEEGLDAPVESFAKAFAFAPYPLWHANQAARYNIYRGVMPPDSGHWLYNHHSDDIDFQIEADYAGIMAPGMVNAATALTDDIGHIMNYGDGWYGGVFVAALYSLAYLSNDINYIVEEAVKTIPAQSRFRRAMEDVIAWHKQYPEDWKIAWVKCLDKHNTDIGCPDGVISPYNIDAVINSAYIAIALLYGEGDFEKTIDIATRCGQDSDCNPASAGGVLGVMMGYKAIPRKFLCSLDSVEDRDFKYTDISLNKVYEMSFGHALQVIEREGGSVDGDKVTIICQKPQPVRFEQGFPGIRPVSKTDYKKAFAKVKPISFEGTGCVAAYKFVKTDETLCPKDDSYTAQVEVWLDGELVETSSIQYNSPYRRPELYSNYFLTKGKHEITFKHLNPIEGLEFQLNYVNVYDSE
ncbi:MAG: ADP-ribosylglycohydrolase family protein, partial [Bacteroidales bacterium]|nr:ADP-ribosylglycohydrolase family protein [Bacteroidales bacterium]